MKFRVLRQISEFEEYQRGFAENYAFKTDRAGSVVPIDYLTRSRVVGVFNGAGDLVAGYVIGTCAPFRLLTFVPEASRSEVLLPGNPDGSDCAEVAAIWKAPGVSNVFMSLRFWPHVLSDVLRSGKKFLLGHNQSERLDQLYTGLAPVTLYFGDSEFGLPSRLFYYGRGKIRLAIAGFVLYETPRRLRRRRSP